MSLRGAIVTVVVAVAGILLFALTLAVSIAIERASDSETAG